MKHQLDNKVRVILVITLIVIVGVLASRACSSLSDSVQRVQQQRVDAINASY